MRKNGYSSNIRSFELTTWGQRLEDSILMYSIAVAKIDKQHGGAILGLCYNLYPSKRIALNIRLMSQQYKFKYSLNPASEDCLESVNLLPIELLNIDA